MLQKGSRQKPYYYSKEQRQVGEVAELFKKGFDGDLRPRNTPPLNLTRKLDNENFIEPANVMGLKSDFPQFEKALVVCFLFLRLMFTCCILQKPQTR